MTGRSGPPSEWPWLLVNLGFTPSGGQDLANFELAKELVRRGREVTLVAHHVDPGLRSAPGVRVVPVERPLKSNLLGERLLERAGLAAFRQHASRKGVHFIGNAGSCPGATVTWAHFVHRAWAPTLQSGAPGFRRLMNGPRSFDARARELRAFNRASLVITNSDRTSRDVEACGISPEKVRRIYLGAAPLLSGAAPVPRKPESPTLIFAGALGWDTRKGLDVVLRAFSLVSRQGRWRHRLVVAGNGSTRPWVMLAQELGILDRVDFVGFVNRPDELMARADLLLSPVRYEAYGLAIQEALCVGTPALFSRNAGIAERLPQECARMLVAADATVADWAGSISYALENLEGLRTAARVARAELLKWSWSHFAHAFIELVEEWQAQRPSARR